MVVAINKEQQVKVSISPQHDARIRAEHVLDTVTPTDFTAWHKRSIEECLQLALNLHAMAELTSDPMQATALTEKAILAVEFSDHVLGTPEGRAALSARRDQLAGRLRRLNSHLIP